VKLFLSSVGIQPHLKNDFLNLLNKPVTEIRLAFITNAADPYPREKQAFVETTRTQIKEVGLKPEPFDLRKYSSADQLYDALSHHDVIWCSGGNTWYLRYVVEKSGFGTAIKRLVEEGKVYGGDSSGAILMTPTLKYIDLIDDPGGAPEIIETGLGLISFCIVPHWDYEDFAEKLKIIKSRLITDGYEVKTITNQQAVIVNGQKAEVI
jgi:dipeptidase E